ncbi:MAG: histidine kinase dimerization/phosphoacceptor domain -containing protein [Candidatus Methylomirabilales bacterium]
MARGEDDPARPGSAGEVGAGARTLEQRLGNALAEKELLLHEVHHRTRNALQILADLFYLQIERLECVEGRHAIEESCARIKVLALVHEQLYEALDGPVVRLGDFLRGVVRGLPACANLAPGVRAMSVRLQIAEEQARLDLDRAIRVGLIVSELLLFALLQPVGGDSACGPQVSLQPDREGVALVVRDPDRQLTPEYLQHSMSLGLRIVRILSEGLQGTLSLDAQGGSCFTLRLPQMPADGVLSFPAQAEPGAAPSPHAARGPRRAPEEARMEFSIPESLRAAHEELRVELLQAMRMEGAVGEAARALASLLRLHFGKEDDYVLLPLGILGMVAQDKIVPPMQAAVAMVERLRGELPAMQAEHWRIGEALDRLREAALAEGRPRIAAFAEKLMRHARLEEEVLYPAAILLGEYLKTRLPRSPASP